MFQFRRFPSYTYVFSIWYTNITSYGLLHSDICGSMSVCDSPQLFAAYHVFRRLLMPRHSPCALLSLTLCLNWFSFEFQIEFRIINDLSIRQYCSLLPINLILKVLFLNISSQFFVFLLCSVFKVLFLQQPRVKLLNFNFDEVGLFLRPPRI